MQPQFSAPVTEKPLRTDSDGIPVMPEWSDDPTTGKPTAPPSKKTTADTPVPPARKRVAKDLQPDATQMDSVVQAKTWLAEHPEEAEMLRQAQSHTGDILADAGVGRRWYSSTEAAAFFDKSVQWLYWGMRHPPHGGRLFVQELKDENGDPIMAVHDGDDPVLKEDGGYTYALPNPNPEQYKLRPVMEDIPVQRIGDPKKGKRRFDIPTIRKFAISAYHRANIKEPKLRAVLQRLVVAEMGGDWKSIPIPKRAEKEPDEPE